jgi:hypothetical protein
MTVHPSDAHFTPMHEIDTMLPMTAVQKIVMGTLPHLCPDFTFHSISFLFINHNHAPHSTTSGRDP